MLNALRQSEENHTFWMQSIKLTFSCSTPYGNQRKITSVTVVRGRSRWKCSTPYGNQRKITSAIASCERITVMCSTPYGNQRKITGFPPHETLGSRLVLNALRQSEENHGSRIESSSQGSGCSTPYGNQRKITAHPRILTLQGSDGAFASMYPYSIHQLPARRQVS